MILSVIYNTRGRASLLWCHNWRDSVSNHQPHVCLFNCLVRCRSKKTSKLHVTGICAGNSPVTVELSEQMTSNAGNVSIWWHYHAAAANYTAPRAVGTSESIRSVFHMATRRLTCSTHDVTNPRYMSLEMTIALNSDIHLNSNTAEMPIKFQTYTQTHSFESSEHTTTNKPLEYELPHTIGAS